MSESSQLPQWNQVEGLPANYFRIGNLHFEDQPRFGMENGGIFEDRAQFWREIHSSLRSNEATADFTESAESGSHECNITTATLALISAILIFILYSH